MSEQSSLDHLRDLLSRGADTPHTVALLTDEELIALDQTEPSTSHPTPWMDGTAAPSRESARHFGARSLFVRGLLTATQTATASSPSLDLEPDVRLTLDLRRVGLGYIRAARSGTAASKIAVVQPELGALEEDISAQGFHLFSACNYTDTLSRIAQWCLPLDVRLAGGTIDVATKDWPLFLHSELPDAKVTDLNVEIYLPDAFGRREPEQWLIAYSDTVAMLARPTTSELLRVRPVTTQRLYDLLDDRLATALRYARRAE